MNPTITNTGIMMRLTTLMIKESLNKMKIQRKDKRNMKGLRFGLVLLASALLGFSLQAAENGGGKELRKTISMNQEWSVKISKEGWGFPEAELNLPGRTPVSGWHFRMEPAGEAPALKAAEVTSSSEIDLKKDGWKKGTNFSFAEDVSGREWEQGGNKFQEGDILYALFRTELPGKPAVKPTMEIEFITGRAWFFLNGKMVGRHQSRAQHCIVDLSAAWKESGTNVLTIMVKAKGNGGISGAIKYVDAGSVVVPTSNVISPDYDDRSWRRVDVPHDYMVEGPIQKTGPDGYVRKVAWYRKTFKAPEGAPGSRIWLEFDGVYRMSRYWLNGKEIAVHPSGYALCRIDITDDIRAGDNTIVLSVDPRLAEGWWYAGGGIYRHVRMVVVPDVHVAPDGIFVRSTIPDPKDGITAPASILVDTTVANTSKKAVELEVRHEIIPADGSISQVGHKKMTLSPGEECVKQTLELSRARLWSCEHPELYTLRTMISVDGKPVDEVKTTFGVRKVEFHVDRGFLLNGKPVKLKGTSNHENHAGVGVAVPDRLHVWRLEQLKKMGSNAYRAGAHQANPVVYDACDRLGILALGEFRIFGDDYDMKAGRDTRAEKLTDQRIQVKQTRNHPSIILWSCGNEEGQVEKNEDGARIARALKNMVNELDGTRLTSMSTHGSTREGIIGVLDVFGRNYGWPVEWDAFRKEFPDKPIIGLESCSEVSTRGFYDRTRFKNRWGGPDLFGDQTRGYVSSYSENGPGWWKSCEENWKAVVERPWFAGTFVWTGFDYKGEPIPFSQPYQPSISSSFGILDTCGFPKDSYYYYKSWWSSEPVLHVFPHWNWPGKEGLEIAVRVYSNCGDVELFLNGKSLGKKTMERNGHLEWLVPYAPGKLEAKGVSQGKSLSTVRETVGEAAGLALAPDRSELTADGNDLAWVAVEVTDAEGRVVPTAGNLVRFSVIGPGTILGVGNGDSSCHDPDKASQRSAFNGLCMVLVQTTRTPGNITLTAESDGLKPVTTTLTTK